MRMDNEMPMRRRARKAVKKVTGGNSPATQARGYRTGGDSPATPTRRMTTGGNTPASRLMQRTGGIMPPSRTSAPNRGGLASKLLDKLGSKLPRKGR